MAQRRKPTAIQIAEGDPRRIGQRKLQERLQREPKPSRGLPPRPKHLKGVAARAWDFWADELTAMGLDFRCDAQMLEGLCLNYARAIEADDMLARAGLTLDDRPHPAVSISSNAWKQVRCFCSALGLSPSSRAGLQVPKREMDLDSIWDMLSQPRARKGGPIN